MNGSNSQKKDFNRKFRNLFNSRKINTKKIIMEVQNFNYKIKSIIHVIVIAILAIINIGFILSLARHVYGVYCANFRYVSIDIFETYQTNSILIWIEWILFFMQWLFAHPITYAFWQAFYDWDMLIIMIINTISLGFYYRNSIFIKQTKIRYLFWFLIFYITIVLGVHFIYYFEAEIFHFIKLYIHKDPHWVIETGLLFYIFMWIILLIKIIQKKK